MASWWSKTYNRPLKDPILQSYTTEELLYEYYNRVERANAEVDAVEEESDKIEDKKLQENLDWAELEEKAELERLLAAEAKAKEVEPVVDPMEDEANREWVEKQIEEAKEVHGESFGEDIDMDFTN